MKHLLIIFSLLITSVSWSKDINFYDLVVRDGLYYKKFTDKPFTGNVTGIVQSKMKNGKWVGVFKRYYKNGQLEYKGTRNSNGKWDGAFIIYFSSGRIMLETNYKDGKLDGKNWHYFSNGQIEHKWNYKNDNREGTQYDYDMSGKLISTEIYKDGKKLTTN